MPVTTLDPVTALLVVDLQKGLVTLPTVHPIGDIIARITALLAAFRARRLPVVLINVAGGAPGRTEQPRRALPLTQDFTDLIPDLAPQQGDLLVTKRSWGAFATTDLDARLKSRGVTQLVITGIATATGVESTARQAYEAGYHVTLATDAMTDPREEAHDYSIRNVFPRLGETGTTREILDMLVKARDQDLP